MRRVPVPLLLVRRLILEHSFQAGHFVSCSPSPDRIDGGVVSGPRLLGQSWYAGFGYRGLTLFFKEKLTLMTIALTAGVWSDVC